MKLSLIFCFVQGKQVEHMCTFIMIRSDVYPHWRRYTSVPSSHWHKKSNKVNRWSTCVPLSWSEATCTRIEEGTRVWQEKNWKIMGQLWDMRQLLKTYGMGWEISKNLKKGSIPSRRDGMGSRPHLSSHAQPWGINGTSFPLFSYHVC